MLVALLLAGCGGGSDDEPRPADGERDVVMVGDSLAVGTEPYLADLLGRDVETDAESGRLLEEGIDLVDDTGVDADDVLAISLFTNNGPTDVESLTDAVRSAANKASCVVWATISAPAIGGDTYDEANRALARLADELGDRMQLVDWAAHIRAYPEHMSYDDVHATPEGYRARARLYADAIRAC